MRAKAFVLLTLLLCAASALAGPVTYNVTVNTSSIANTVGSFDFNFNPGPLKSQTASVQVLSFDGVVSGSPQTAGSVTGTLPTPITFTNGEAFNDYFQGVKFGTVLSFSVNLSGPALSSPDGTSSSGSTFAFSMFSDEAGTKPALTADSTDGFAFLIAVNLNGTTEVSNFSKQTVISAPPPPSCQLKQIIDGPPRQLDVAMQDTHSGLATVKILSAVNAKINVPMFAKGSTAAIIVTATKVDQSKSSTVSFQVTNSAGQSATCDPIDFTASVEQRVETHTFRALNETEHYIRIVNGSPGLKHATFLVNGVRFHEMDLANDEERVVNVGSAMKPGSDNHVLLIARGPRGSTAFVLIGDQSIR
jgi:hypothetical protein